MDENGTLKTYANTAKCIAALEMILCIWHISLDGDLWKISFGCVRKYVASWPLAWKIEEIWIPLTTSVFTWKPSWKVGSSTLAKKNTLLHSSVPTGYLGLGLVAFPGSWKPIGITGACFSCCSLQPCSHPLDHIWQSFHRRKEVKLAKFWATEVWVQ